MKVTHNTPDLLVLRFTRWEGPLIWAFWSLWCLGVIGLIAAGPGLSGIALFLSLLLTVGWMAPLAIYRAERSMLTLNATSGMADLSHRTIRGLEHMRWPLDEVQSTRVTRRTYIRKPADKDPKRFISLYVREGMDEGRHKIAIRPVRAAEALDASALISDWMKDWRKRQ